MAKDVPTDSREIKIINKRAATMMCKGRTAIVTGAAGSGMGRSIALTLAREGANIVVNYLTSAKSAEVIVRHIESREGCAFAFQADIQQKDECKKLVDATMKKFGKVDICIIGPGGGWHAEPIDKLNSINALDDTNRELAPIYHLMSLVLPDMYTRKWGRLIGISLNPNKTSPAYSYNVAKSARNDALFHAQDSAWAHGVTVNTICPGPVEALPSLEVAIEMCDHGKCWMERTNITPQDIAEGVAMLCSEAGRYITGCQLPYMFR